MPEIITRTAHANNYRRGRAWRGAVDMIVIHVTEGSASSVRYHFADPRAGVTTQYMVAKDGTIDQFVSEGDTAYHAGRVERPTAPLVLERPDVNPNVYSIGIEHEGDGTTELTDAQRAASLWLLRDICTRRKIPMTRRHIVGHREIYAKKTCPGAIDVDRLVRDLGERNAPVPPANPPLVVWSAYLKDWLIVTRIVNDREWFFRRLSEVQAAPERKSTESLNAMPRRMT